MSQPCDLNCRVAAPGRLDEELQEFWVGSPWEIMMKHNLSCFERNRTYLNVAGQDFVDVSYLSGADNDGDSRSAIAVDFRNQGQLDLVVRQVGGGPLVIYENHFPPRHYLKVSLRGTRSNRLGLGSRLVATVGDRQIVREMYPVNSYRSQNPLLAHFGLDQAERVDQLLIRWPSGHEQRFQDLSGDRHILIEEGSDAITTVNPGVP